jgi:peroxiredoxin
MMLAQVGDAGVDFSGADISLVGVTAKKIIVRTELDGEPSLHAEAIHFTFSVRSNRSSKSGKPVAGIYTIATGRCCRRDGTWAIQEGIRWEILPSGLLAVAVEHGIYLEDYVAEHHVLLPGTEAPDVELTRLDTGAKVGLHDWRGKFVILQFWSLHATVPGQAPEGELQELRARHPDWSGRVEIVTVSIDERSRFAAMHMLQNGWTNTINTWAGPGEWFSPAAKAMRITAIPTQYIIGPDGRIIRAGAIPVSDTEKLIESILSKP